MQAVLRVKRGDNGLLTCRKPVQAPRAVPHFNFLRKPASDFGWDWGPAFAPAGLGGVTLAGDQGLEILGVRPLPCNSFLHALLSIPAPWDYSRSAAGNDAKLVLSNGKAGRSALYRLKLSRARSTTG